MAKVLIHFAHPNLEKSRVQKLMLRQASAIERVTINDLYEQYPDFDIDIQREKKLLLEHDVIIFQHPFYWYNTPAIIKQWFDLVLEHGWAYGKNGTSLTGKWMLNAISCGGSAAAYTKEGRNRFTIRELLAPIEQTALLCHMQYLPPFVVYGTHRLEYPELEFASLQYAQLLHAFCSDHIELEEVENIQILNELAPITAPLLS